MSSVAIRHGDPSIASFKTKANKSHNPAPVSQPRRVSHPNATRRPTWRRARSFAYLGDPFFRTLNDVSDGRRQQFHLETTPIDSENRQRHFVTFVIAAHESRS